MRDRYYSISRSLYWYCLPRQLGSILVVFVVSAKNLPTHFTIVRRRRKAYPGTRTFRFGATADSRDEIGLLVETFNEMLARIQEQNQELQKAHDELEQRVIERTAQLEAANKELEAFLIASPTICARRSEASTASARLTGRPRRQARRSGQAISGACAAATQRMAQLIDDMLNLSR